MSASISVKLAHCQAMMSRMWDLRSEDHQCDITIKAGEKKLHCHRIILSAACDYFHTMFSGSFEERSATEVTIHGVDPDTFGTILQFIYTGDADINSSNACDLINAAGYYGLALLEKYLIRFMRRNYRTLLSEDILKMFNNANAHITRMKSLSKCLGERIYADVGFFSDSPEFINLTWDSLMTLVSLASEAGMLVLSDTLVEGILKWISGQADASADKRREYFEKFLKTLHDRKSFTNCIQHVIDRYKNASEQAPGANAVAVLGERPQKLLRAFIRRSLVGGTSVYSLHETNAGSEWAYSGEFKSVYKHMKSMAVDDSLYTMTASSFDEAGASFTCHRRAYDGAPHLSMHKLQHLKRPPCVASHFEMCGKDNHIFVYNKMPVIGRAYDRISINSSSGEPEITDEELQRGVISYRRDVDRWFSVPPPRKYRMSCMTCDERMVYLIGGTDSHGAVQAYDTRTPAWMNLPPTARIYEDAASCICDGKVWVVGGMVNPTSVEIFDPVSSTWRRGNDLTESRTGEGKVVNWDSVRYGPTVVSYRKSILHTNSGILFSDHTRPTGWNKLPRLTDALRYTSDSVSGSDYNRVSDMVVF